MTVEEIIEITDIWRKAPAGRFDWGEAREDVLGVCADWRRQRALIHRLEGKLGMERDTAMAEMVDEMTGSGR